MDPEQHREISKLGGQAVHAQDKAHEFTREEARHAGQRGGWVTSRDRKHMARIGRIGGATTARKKRTAEAKGEK
jgi:general stress protein YciG